MVTYKPKENKHTEKCNHFGMGFIRQALNFDNSGSSTPYTSWATETARSIDTDHAIAGMRLQKSRGCGGYPYRVRSVMTTNI